MELASYGDLAVRLVNTGHPGRPEDDALQSRTDVGDLLGDPTRWAAESGPADVAALRALRDALREVFELAAAGQAEQAVARLNALLDGSVIRPQITGHDAQDWHLHIYDRATDVVQAYRAAAVMGLAVLFTEVGAERFGSCQAASCCNVFVDTSTNRSRRYCSDRCATRANVAAYRARRRAAGSETAS